MSQENVEVIRRLLPSPDVDIAQALRDDDLWAVASKAAFTTSTFSCDIAYSERPMASRASAWLAKSR